MITQNSVLLLKSQNADDNAEDKYEKILKENGFKVLQVKTLIFNFKNLETLANKVQNSDEFSGFIFSSPRCVQAVELAAKNKDVLEKWKDKHNFVVGEATYKSANEKLLLSCEGRDTGNALNLSKIIVEKKSHYSKPFLFPHGNLKTDCLNLELSKEGLKLEGVEVYDTVANENIENELSEITANFTTIPEYVVFFSPSGFSAAIDHIRKVPIDFNLVKLVAIGPTTETAILERDFKVYGVAKRPNPEELLATIKRLD